MGRARLADHVIACYLIAACTVLVLEELMAEVTAAPPIPAWLAAEFDAAASRADPEEPR